MNTNQVKKILGAATLLLLGSLAFAPMSIAGVTGGTGSRGVIITTATSGSGIATTISQSSRYGTSSGWRGNLTSIDSLTYSGPSNGAHVFYAPSGMNWNGPLSVLGGNFFISGVNQVIGSNFNISPATNVAWLSQNIDPNSALNGVLRINQGSSSVITSNSSSVQFNDLVSRVNGLSRNQFFGASTNLPANVTIQVANPTSQQQATDASINGFNNTDQIRHALAATSKPAPIFLVLPTVRTAVSTAPQPRLLTPSASPSGVPAAPATFTTSAPSLSGAPAAPATSAPSSLTSTPSGSGSGSSTSTPSDSAPASSTSTSSGSGSTRRPAASGGSAPASGSSGKAPAPSTAPAASAPAAPVVAPVVAAPVIPGDSGVTFGIDPNSP